MWVICLFAHDCTAHRMAAGKAGDCGGGLQGQWSGQNNKIRYRDCDTWNEFCFVARVWSPDGWLGWGFPPMIVFGVIELLV